MGAALGLFFQVGPDVKAEGWVHGGEDDAAFQTVTEEIEEKGIGDVDIPYAFFFDLFRYSLESRVVFPAMYPPFCFDIRAHLKEKAKRRAQEKQR